MGSERRRMRKIHTSGKSCRKWGTLGFLATGLFAFFSTATFAQQKTDTPVQLHPQNPHYFLFHGKAMALIGSGEHYGAVFNGDFDYHKYLQTLEAEGMNYTRLFGGSYVEMPAKSFGILRNDLAPAPGRFVAPWARTDTAGYAGGGNKFDLSKWNPEYFQRCTTFWKKRTGAALWSRSLCSPRNMPMCSGIFPRSNARTMSTRQMRSIGRS